MNARTALVAIVGAATMFGGCACAPSDLAGLPIEDGDAVAVDRRPVAELRLYPAETTDTMCDNLGTGHGGEVLSIPCRDIINACIPNNDGTRSSMWMAQTFQCDDQSPTLATVCSLAPTEQLAFYGLEPDDCVSDPPRAE